MHMKRSLHPDVHVSGGEGRREPTESLQSPQSPSEERTGRDSLLSLTSHPSHIWHHLIEDPLFSGLSGKFLFFFFIQTGHSTPNDKWTQPLSSLFARRKLPFFFKFIFQDKKEAGSPGLS